jgi:hypothetical protein
VNLADVVQPEFRDAVQKVVKNPTIATRATGEQVVCTVAVYEWLYDHPDRVALAWMRLKVPAITITDLGGGKFAWTDENGSEVVWQTVGTVAGDAWSDALPEDKGIEADWTDPLTGCGHFDTATNACTTAPEL